MSLRSFGRKIWQTLSAIKTGVILLITVVILSAVGTIILQRPATEADEMQRAYSAQALRIFDALGLTDVFHAWWFVALLVLVSLSIVAASIERFPNAWRFFARPCKYPDQNFRRFLPAQKEFPIPDEETGLVAAERALHSAGFTPERVVHESHFSLFAERNRISEMAVYIVHASLLLIFLGGIIDALVGWRGFLMLTPGKAGNQIEMKTGVSRTLPFSIRCDAAGEETYTDGTPKKYWSKLAVVDQDQEVSRKEIVVNDPLVYQGVRFYQASYGRTGKLEQLVLNATRAKGGPSEQITLAMNQIVALDADTKVQLLEFIPDFVVQDGHVYARSNDVVNPAVHMIVTSEKTNAAVNYWLPEISGIAENASSPYIIEPKDLKTGVFTGLEVSHEPGQWAVWAGVVLMAIGLTFVFYVVHMRLWVVPVQNANGTLSLWIGGSANRNRDAFEEKFNNLVEEIKNELKPVPVPASGAQVASLAGK
jgi:cytochrome c biogenesis protein